MTNTPSAAVARLGGIRSAVLLVAVVVLGAALGIWKYTSVQAASAAASSHPEPMESIAVAVAERREHSPATTAIGTVIALRSVTLRNELPGTVKRVALTPGQTVEAGTVLVALDVAVEEAELAAQQAQADLAQTLFDRALRMSERGAASATELDTARAERDVALAQVARTKAIIARKTIRAPFRARVGISDVHPGQYLNEGTQLTTLQGVDDAAYVDFLVAQHVAAALREGAQVEVVASRDTDPIVATIIATDSRVDPSTRNAMVRARVQGRHTPTPGASVRVRVPVGPARSAVAVPVNALRKGPSGDHVFVVQADKQGKMRAHVRAVAVTATLGDEVLIHEGLEAGEKVAASGSFKLREAALVAVTAAAETPVASVMR
jgi:membrane fusion protein, multidrug efflux system